MKLYFLLPLLGVLSCSTSQETDGPLPVPDTSVGGWTEQSLDWDTALRAFDLVKEKVLVDHPTWTGLSLRRVESQVVAGFHIRLTIAYQEGTDTKLLRAVIFHDIDGNRTLDALEAPFQPKGENR